MTRIAGSGFWEEFQSKWNAVASSCGEPVGVALSACRAQTRLRRIGADKTRASLILSQSDVAIKEPRQNAAKGRGRFQNSHSPLHTLMPL